MAHPSQLLSFDYFSFPDNSPDGENCLYFTAVFTIIHTVLDTVPTVLSRPCSTVHGTYGYLVQGLCSKCENFKYLQTVLYDMHLCIENTLFVQMCVFYIIKQNVTNPLLYCKYSYKRFINCFACGFV